MNNFTTNRAIQNVNNHRNKSTQNKQQEKIDADILKKIKLIEKAFK
jgi:hypothetical protein